MASTSVDPERVKREPVCIIGAGPAGLITAQVLLNDGFQNVQVLCKDATVGGVWAKGRVYPSMYTNNVHGELRFSALPMTRPSSGGGPAAAERRLKGTDVCSYMEEFHDKFLVIDGKSVVQFNTEVLRIQRGGGDIGWNVDVRDSMASPILEGNVGKGLKTLHFPRIVVCTGGTSAMNIPSGLEPAAALHAGFTGPVIHSGDSWGIMDAVQEAGQSSGKPVVVVGGGKSAQDISAYLANQSVPVKLVCNQLDMFLVSNPSFSSDIRQSRISTLLAPRRDLNTLTELFLHNTWLGGKLTKKIWESLAEQSFSAYNIPKSSPLRNTRTMFWDVRYGDEGVPREDSFPALALEGKIKLGLSTRVSGYYEEGMVLDTGEKVEASAIILATGYKSSWDSIFDEETANEIGLTQLVDPEALDRHTWDYTSLHNAPKAEAWISSTPIRASGLYKGIVPARSIQRRDMAVNGAVFSVNIGYSWEVAAHWISSYFLGEKMRLPETVEDATEETIRNLAWIKTRFPNSTIWKNPSYASALPQLGWIQAADDLLEDLYLPSMRSGGNWLTWAFRPVRSEELAALHEERSQKRGK